MDEVVGLLQSCAPLLLPTHVLLTQGGDDRLRVSPETLTNRYYNHFYGLSSSEFLQRGSCTASSPTVHSYDLALKLRLDWLGQFIAQKADILSPVRNPYLNIVRLLFL